MVSEMSKRLGTNVSKFELEALRKQLKSLTEEAERVQAHNEALQSQARKVATEAHAVDRLNEEMKAFQQASAPEAPRSFHGAPRSFHGAPRTFLGFPAASTSFQELPRASKSFAGLLLTFNALPLNLRRPSAPLRPTTLSRPSCSSATGGRVSSRSKCARPTRAPSSCSGSSRSAIAAAGRKLTAADRPRGGRTASPRRPRRPRRRLAPT